MWQRVKYIGFLFCLIPCGLFVFQLMLPGAIRQHANRSTFEQVPTILPLVLAQLGVIILLVDAFRREYDGPSAWPIAIAIVGVLTWGLMSIVYYLIWGWMPTKQERVRANDFCDACRAESTDEAVRAFGTFNGLGFRLIGSAKPCDVCGSKIKTLWYVILVPILPLGSYRFIKKSPATVTQSWFIARKFPAIYWRHVWPVALALAFIVGWILLLEMMK